jgi:hypothetical protein
MYGCYLIIKLTSMCDKTSLCSVSLILRALHYKQQIPVYNLCFDPIGNMKGEYRGFFGLNIFT